MGSLWCGAADTLKAFPHLPSQLSLCRPHSLRMSPLGDNNEGTTMAPFDTADTPPEGDAEKQTDGTEEQIPPIISQPDRLDNCLRTSLVAATLSSFAMNPLRVWLLNNPVPDALMVGGYTSSIVGRAGSTPGGI